MTTQVISIRNSEDERLREFSELKDDALRKKQLIIVDSDKVVMRMLGGGCRIKKLLVTSRFLKLIETGQIKLDKDVEIFHGEKSLVEQIVGYRLHHGVIAIAERPYDSSLFELGDRLVILNGVVSSENVGAIARCCHAFGFTGLIADHLSCSPWVRRSIRVSMGSVFSLKTYHTNKLLQVIADLKKRDFAIYGSGLVAGSISSKGFTPRDKFALILGSEGEGIQEAISSTCDQIVQIPISHDTDSLNVAVASGILLYEFGCQT